MSKLTREEIEASKRHPSRWRSKRFITEKSEPDMPLEDRARRFIECAAEFESRAYKPKISDFNELARNHQIDPSIEGIGELLGKFYVEEIAVRMSGDVSKNLAHLTTWNSMSPLLFYLTTEYETGNADQIKKIGRASLSLAMIRKIQDARESIDTATKYASRSEDPDLMRVAEDISMQCHGLERTLWEAVDVTPLLSALPKENAQAIAIELAGRTTIPEEYLTEILEKYESSGNFEEAAELSGKAGFYERAIDYCFTASEKANGKEKHWLLDKASNIARESGDYLLRIKVCEIQGDFYTAGLFAERAGQHAKAVDLFAQSDDPRVIRIAAALATKIRHERAKELAIRYNEMTK
ncbi:hypothetical protein HYU11_00515 [Candidatus Woesearchaeota archaeon]|nr:hypothetical protein [Candidatus Woesearchaeota archaeon]